MKACKCIYEQAPKFLLISLLSHGRPTQSSQPDHAIALKFNYYPNLTMASPETHNSGLLLTSFGALNLVDLPLPTASPGSVVIQVLATYIPSNAKSLYAGTNPFFDFPFPLTPGLSSVGRVHAIGPDAAKLKTGDLVFVDPTVTARDDDDVVILQGHFQGWRPEGKVLMEKMWRNGPLQKYMLAPLENYVLIDESKLCGELKYAPAELVTAFPYMVAAGPLIESAKLQAGETIVIGPASGSYSGACFEVALALGANVVALGRSPSKFANMLKSLGHPKRLQCVVMTGCEADDVVALQKAVPNGAHVYSDWSPTGSKDAIYLSTVAAVLRRSARVVLSGAANTSVGLPHGIMVLKDIEMKGKYMYNRSTVRTVFELVALGLLELGERTGALARNYELESFEDALAVAEEHGTWRDFTIITPNI
jgi:D-arabinose 1-dehydrogenase-like Zn-dependent alcohol dehydrogenase